MIFHQIRTGGDRNFGYFIGDEDSKESAVIDPSYSPEKFIEIASENDMKIRYIINTHFHGDHSGGSYILKNKTGAKIVMHKSAHIQHDISVDDGDIIKLGKLELKVIYTPGHTPDSISILANNKLMTGDTLFVGKIGGTNTDEAAKIEFDSLFNKIMKLDDSVEIFPGHDYGIAPTSTIQNERKTNPFILRPNFSDFKWLKDNWADYKLKHGIK
ncbi:MAG: MBL fold metallo-hydrolase [bacterium]